MKRDLSYAGTAVRKLAKRTTRDGSENTAALRALLLQDNVTVVAIGPARGGEESLKEYLLGLQPALDRNRVIQYELPRPGLTFKPHPPGPGAIVRQPLGLGALVGFWRDEESLFGASGASSAQHADMKTAWDV